MPLYLFRCAMCGNEKQLPLAMTERDEQAVYCLSPNCRPAIPGGACRMERVPTAPAFTIEGFSAANGYSKDKQ